MSHALTSTAPRTAPVGQSHARPTDSADRQVTQVPPAATASDWSETSLTTRLTWARSLRRVLASRADELCGLITEETHKPHWEALTADILPLLAACRWHERHARRILAPRRLRGRPFWLPGQAWVEHRHPIGRVAIIATWNYPVQLLGVQMLQALIAGNTFVVKPSELAPRTQARLIELFIAAGLPAETIRAWPASRESGPRMLREERPDHIVFTGSTSVGREIAAWAAEHLIPTTLELSGSDSALVLGDADAALAARTVWHAATMNAGQTCMAPRRVLVDRRVYPAFLAALAPLAAGAQPRRLISSAAAERTFAQVIAATATPPARSLSGVCEAPADAWFRPLAIVDCPLASPLLAGEHFGPVLAVAPVDSTEAALAVHAVREQRLATSIFTADRRLALALAPRLGSAIITVNDCVLPTGHPGASLAGRGLSGWGATRGAAGLLGMTRPVQVCRSSMLRPPINSPPSARASRLQRLMLRMYGAK